MYYGKGKVMSLKEIADYPAPEVSEKSYSQRLNTAGRAKGEAGPVADFGKYFGRDVGDGLLTATNKRNETNIEKVVEGVPMLFKDYEAKKEAEKAEAEQRLNNIIKNVENEYMSGIDFIKKLDMGKIVKEHMEILGSYDSNYFKDMVNDESLEENQRTLESMAEKVETDYYDRVLSYLEIDTDNAVHMYNIELSMSDIRKTTINTITEQLAPLLEDYKKVARESNYFELSPIKKSYIEDCILPQLYPVMRNKVEKDHSGRTDGFYGKLPYEETKGILREMIESIMPDTKWAPNINFSYHTHTNDQKSTSEYVKVVIKGRVEASFKVNWDLNKDVEKTQGDIETEESMEKN